MRRALVVSFAVLLACASAAAAQELRTDEQKTLYILGLVISQNLSVFQLLSDGVLKREPKVDVQVYAPKLQGLQVARRAAVAAVEKKAGQAFVDRVAAEAGATKTASGLVVRTLKPGTGPSPKASDKVRVHYTGTLIDGTVFDSSVQRKEPIVLGLGGGVIKCWTEGVPLIKVGGRSRLVCPSDLAYGDQGRPPWIKPGATLVFEIELLEIVK